MPLGKIERKLRRMKQDVSDISRKPPSSSSMVDGEERLVLHGNNNLRIYKKESGTLWYLEFTRT